MPKQRFGLGRGIDALIPSATPVPEDVPLDTGLSNSAVFEVALGSIAPNPQQPRMPIGDDTQLLELATSIQEYGLLQPVLVALEGQDEDGPRYRLIAGERRWRAAELAGLDRIPVVIREATPQLMLEMALVENLQRTDLNPLEEAQAYQMLVEEYGLTHDEIAKRLGRNRATISNTLRLLQLPQEVRDALIQMPKSFTEGHARAVLQVLADADRIALTKQIIAQMMSVRQAEEMARRYNQGALQLTPDRRGASVRSQSVETMRIEQIFTQAIEMKVRVQRSVKGSGAITLYFNTDEQLETLYQRLSPGQSLLTLAAAPDTSAVGAHATRNGASNGHNGANGSVYSVPGDGMDGLLDETFDLTIIDADEPDADN